MALWVRILIVSAIGGGFMLALPCTNLSERFYLTIPVLALALFATEKTDVRSRLKTALHQGLLLLAAYLLLAVGLAGTHFGSPLILPQLPWDFWWRTASAFCYFAGLAILFFWMRRLLFWPGEFLEKRWKLSAVVRLVCCQLLPAALLMVLALPLGLAFSNVHRFKVPNLSDPYRYLGRAFEDESFPSADGTQLQGWWIPALRPSGRTLIMVHGASNNRAMLLPRAELGDWLEANIFMLDLRGHGDSEGQTVTLGCREKDDVLAAIAHVRRVHGAESRELIGMGASLGAVSMAQAAAAAESPLKAVILDSCFTSTREMTHSALKTFPDFCHPPLLALGLPLANLHAGCAMMDVCPEATIDRLRAPVLFLHSRGDPLIPSQHSIRLHARAAEPKQLLIFELEGHCDGFFACKEQYRDAVLRLVGR